MMNHYTARRIADALEQIKEQLSIHNTLTAAQMNVGQMEIAEAAIKKIDDLFAQQ